MVEAMDGRSKRVLSPPAGTFQPFQVGPLHFREADGEADMRRIHQLHFRTFTRELGQYQDRGQGYHIDKFHDKNHYLICEADGVLVGMLAAHSRPPFSFASRLPDGTRVEDLSHKPLEVRLLAVDDGYRKGRVAGGLMYAIYLWAATKGFGELFISAVSEQLPLYRGIGFRELGPPVPQGDCSFTPMIMPLNEASLRRKRAVERLAKAGLPDASLDEPVSLLPGPPQISAKVLNAVGRRARYHRSRAFLDQFEEVRRRLSPLMAGRPVALLAGSGTLANDMVAAQLKARFGDADGLVLVTGEFGRRLARQAHSAGLRFHQQEWSWGGAWTAAEIEELLHLHRPEWLWAVQLETSSGVLHDCKALAELCAAHGVALALDSVSAVGAVPVPAGVTLASGVAGKCLGALAGASFVAADPDFLTALNGAAVPSSFDLARMMQTVGPCFTFPSAPVQALDRALDQFEGVHARAERQRAMSLCAQRVRQGLAELGIQSLAPESRAAPVVTTFKPPHGLGSLEFVALARKWGFRVAGASSYLQERRWVQVANMGEVDASHIESFLKNLGAWLDSHPSKPASPRLEH